ncbi:U-box domain-containing protein 33 isoform X1 [Malania oleifera]|uniref:U-box domain-containing protein 33 isoform X1 n=1 Tax=Malania oleifera TaxID=397392 RepID=UPI0025ADFB1C|nr:U-box domain-containing protein 33 isoform X1 [Malania oleifera]
MAVMSPVSAFAHQISPIRFRDVGVSGTMPSTGEITEEPVAQLIEEKIYVAVGKDLKESKLTLLSALHNSGGRRICILHVHQPAQLIPLSEFGTRLPASRVTEQQVTAYQKIERQNMHKILDDYLVMCHQRGVQAEKLYTEMCCIEKGIVELVSQCGIRKLIMGAAADKHYSRKMTELKSKKAIYVCSEAPASCHIQFLCKGRLIHTRESSSDGVDILVRPLPQQVPPNIETEQSKNLRSQSLALGQNTYLGTSNPGHYMMQRVTSVNFDVHRGGEVLPLSSPDTGEAVTSPSKFDAEGSSDECDWTSIRSSSHGSGTSSCSSREIVGHKALIPIFRTKRKKEKLEKLLTLPQSNEDLHSSSPPSVLEGRMNDELYDQLEQAMVEASKQDAFEESVRLGKVDRDAIEAICKAKTSESLYMGESKRRKEIEEALAKENSELAKIKNQRDEVMKELQIALEQKQFLESQISNSDQIVKELEEKIISAVELLQNYKRERDELQIEHDKALKEAEELRKKQVEEASMHMLRLFSEFSFSEIKEATHNFDPSLEIGVGGYGSIYQGILRHTQVAIKMLRPNGSQGPTEYQQEVEVLSRLRHPNLVTLIGACPEAWALIYEYLPNGSLEDRLHCRDNTAPLSWQTRIRIAVELCSVLIFLHSIEPHSIVHGDLKPSNILLDANFVSKLSDFGICRLIARNENLISNTTLCHITNPKGTPMYMDPEFTLTGELTPKSDVYSFGIILLQLLTGRPALGITKEVQYALDKGNLNTLLDPSAGDWPFVQAKQLAHLALRCCEMNRRNRPDLASEVWRVLEPMRLSCGGSPSSRLGSEEHKQIPPYFICPIFQEVMQDPHVAADGFTYEAEAIRGWLDSGNDTSPMTNHKLAHCNLVPNQAIRSAIQEWLQQR